MGSKSKRRRQTSDHKGRRGPRRSNEMVPLSQLLTPEVTAWLTALGVTTGVLGALGLSRLAFLGWTAAGMLTFYLLRYRSVSVLLRSLQSRWSFKALLYGFVALALATAVGVVGFRVGSRLGQTEGIRKTLRALKLPVRPLPPPRPRFPGHVDVDAFCRSEGPFQAVAPVEYGIVVEWEDGTVSEHPLPTKEEYDQRFGEGQYIVCAGRTRDSFGPVSETKWVVVRVRAICRWQYPGQDVRAIPPRDPRDLDGWRCQLPSGKPASWPD